VLLACRVALVRVAAAYALDIRGREVLRGQAMRLLLDKATPTARRGQRRVVRDTAAYAIQATTQTAIVPA
jgi:hypothetical protein